MYVAACHAIGRVLSDPYALTPPQHITVIMTGYKKDIEEKLLTVDPGL